MSTESKEKIRDQHTPKQHPKDERLERIEKLLEEINAKLNSIVAKPRRAKL
ncbi:MAG: hypothetical protein K9W46_00155 [Candidatus Heimdallarchaeum endolithica]|uniref:Uncharacterized protein n=1 Tax=Candidatus Heimdallarchaeum endolithica TaxID=2876572 RepID=A0A9Y1BSM1_9ARCH|nr:MAG: hypothetical protein K9W46_00155 [Candidatus Heimdallarchaeum endolithica]